MQTKLRNLRTESGEPGALLAGGADGGEARAEKTPALYRGLSRCTSAAAAMKAASNNGRHNWLWVWMRLASRNRKKSHPEMLLILLPYYYASFHCYYMGAAPFPLAQYPRAVCVNALNIAKGSTLYYYYYATRPTYFRTYGLRWQVLHYHHAKRVCTFCSWLMNLSLFYMKYHLVCGFKISSILFKAELILHINAIIWNLPPNAFVSINSVFFL